MVEWHITPDFVVANWTEELLELMIEKLIERKERETAAIQGHRTSGRIADGGDQIVSDKVLFAQLGSKLKVNRAI